MDLIEEAQDSSDEDDEDFLQEKMIEKMLFDRYASISGIDASILQTKTSIRASIKSDVSGNENRLTSSSYMKRLNVSNINNTDEWTEDPKE